MISAFTSPILVPEEGTAALLERVPLAGPESAEAYTENWLQNLIYHHPQALPVREIDESFTEMVPVCQEMQTPAGSIDVVYVTTDGRPAIVEAKLWRNPEARRKVIGQVLDYAKELSRWDFDAFDAAVRRARHSEDKGASKGLLEVMGYGDNTLGASRFHDSLTRNLRRGELLLLVVGDGIREGVGAITDFLERQGTLHFTFGLIEMAIYRMPGGGQLVQPRILAQSTIIKRILVDLRHESLRVEESSVEDAEGAAEEALSAELAEARKRFNAFWVDFQQKLRLDDKRQVVGPPAHSQNQYFAMPKESGAWLAAFLAPSQQRAGVYLTFSKGPIGDRLYAALRNEKSAIEHSLGVPVEWKSDGRKHWITSSRHYTGSVADDYAQDVQRTLADWTNRYVNVFRSRLEKLAQEST